jgi:hypothetical protein
MSRRGNRIASFPVAVHRLELDGGIILKPSTHSVRLQRAKAGLTKLSKSQAQRQMIKTTSLHPIYDRGFEHSTEYLTELQTFELSSTY